MVLLLLILAGLVLGIEYLKNPTFRIGAGLGVFLTFLAIGILLPTHFAYQKVAGRLAMPTGLLWLVLYAVMVADLRTRQWRRAGLSCAIFFGYWICGSDILGSRLIHYLEQPIHLSADDDRRPFDAVCILGGGTQLSPRGDPELGSSGDRIRLAAELWHKKRTPVIVASGNSPPPFGLGDLSEHTKKLLVGLNVYPESIRQLSHPVNTTEEMAAFIQLAKDAGWKRVGLISSAWHLPRALTHARDDSVQFIPLPADHRVGPMMKLHAIDIIPSAHGFMLVHIWAWETLGRLVGR